MRERIVIQGGADGLGDQLLLSSLPELFVRERNCEVFVHSTKFRNPGIKKLVWDNNPFVTGFTDDPKTTKDINWTEIAKLTFIHKSNVKAMEVFFGFYPNHSLYPKIYNVQYELKPELLNKTVIDPTALTTKYTKEIIEKYINSLVDFNIID